MGIGNYEWESEKQPSRLQSGVALCHDGPKSNIRQKNISTALFYIKPKYTVPFKITYKYCKQNKMFSLINTWRG